MQDWINRIGVTLQFISLWLVTPQILGEKRLLDAAERLRLRAESVLEKMLKPQGIKNRLTPTGAAVLSSLLGSILFLAIKFGWPDWISGLIAIFIVPALVVLAPFVLLYSILRAFYFVIKLIARSIHQVLIVGAVLFTAGFVLLIWATWLPR